MKLTIRKRLLLANLATLACVAICGSIGLLAVRSQGLAMDGISANGAAIKDQLQADMAHDAIRGDVLAALAGAANADGTQQAEAAKDLAQHAATFRERLGSMAEKASDPDIRNAMASVGPDAEAYLASAGRMVQMAMADKDAAQAGFAAFMVQFRKLEESMGALSERIEKHSEAAAQQADVAAAGARLQIVTVSVLAMLVALVLGIVTTRAIVRPLDAAIGSAARIAQGDLCSGASAPADADDTTETGRLSAALSNMRVSLHSIVQQVRQGTDSIATASGQIAEGNMDLSARTEVQAGTLEETAASMEQLTATVRQNADNARQAATLATSASDVATRGGAVVGEVVETMGAIDQASTRIGDIIGVIEAIAFQTNILALNAAVEAARAGDQGRGFAVVAMEVRALAQRANTAAREIKDLIDASATHVERGSKLVRDAGATMDEIVKSVRMVTDIMSEISAASNEQEAGISQVNKAVVEIDGITQQNAALVEEAAAAAAAMQEQAGELARIVNIFQLNTGNAGPVARPSPVPAKQLALSA